MANYVDGFVITIPKKNLKAYFKMAQQGGEVWKEHGALQYFETVGDDLNINPGLPFPKLTKAKPSETIIFSWITYKSKAHRNAVNKKVMQDPRLSQMCDPKKMPFKMERMSYGGFKIVVEF
ncbi:MAG: DUF1428 domain-containing protein [Pseudomonadota bacterium]